MKTFSFTLLLLVLTILGVKSAEAHHHSDYYGYNTTYRSFTNNYYNYNPNYDDDYYGRNVNYGTFYNYIPSDYYGFNSWY